MTTLFVVVLVGLTVLTLVALAVALVLAVDRVRATADRLLAARAAVLPRLEELRTEAERARAHAGRLQRSRLRPGDDELTAP